MNLVILTGNLTRDPELKFGQTGTAYSKFSIAVNNPLKKDEANFINCVAFGKTAELIGEYLRKGSKVGINGRLQMNRYEKDGEKRTTYDVVVDNIEFLDSKNSNSQQSSGNFYNQQQQPSAPRQEENRRDYSTPSKSESFDNDDDEFPF